MRRKVRKKYSLWWYYGLSVCLLPLAVLSAYQKHVELSISFVTLALVLSYLFYRNVSPPLRQMRRTAERLAKGDFEARLPEYDVLEISKLATAMNKMGSQLKHLEEVRRDFVANVSHELKTPITSIKGFVETLLDGAMEDPADSQRFLAIVGHQAERLMVIVEDLLTLAHLESGRAEGLGLFQEEEMGAVLDAAKNMLLMQAQAKNISVDIACETKLMAVMDRALMEQAVGNLINNAIKYSGANTTVRVDAKRLSDEVIVEVVDQGPGIAPEHLPRLFERFYRVDKARSRKLGGTGLGLAIVKHIAGVHGGAVEVQSSLGKGSSFRITIPNDPRH